MSTDLVTDRRSRQARGVGRGNGVGRDRGEVGRTTSN